jgi:3-oxoadipate enol-lactonase
MPRIRIDGIRINYDEAGSGENLILIHGLGFTRRSWSLQLPAFSKRYRTIAPDCRGHGDSDKPAEQHGVRDMSEDLYGLMNALGLDRAHILGISMGGQVAQQFALDHATKVIKLVLCDTRSRPNPAFTDRLLQQIATLEPEALARTVLQDEMTYPISDAALKINLEDIIRNPKDAYIRDVRAALDWDVTERLGEIRLPTLIVAGEKDSLLEECKSLNEKIRASKLVIIRRSGHLTCLENPGEFNKAVLDFLMNT